MCTSPACCETTEYENKMQTIRSKLLFVLLFVYTTNLQACRAEEAPFLPAGDLPVSIR